MAEKFTRKVPIFNCDSTFKLDTVVEFLLQVNGKHDLNISTERHYFRLNEMAKFCETTIPELQMDFAVFVIHANESRLSINEDNAGIGYAKIYRALQQATEDKVLIIIGGDDHYRDENEEENFVISRWARRKVASQFNEEYLDGSKSFILSWDSKHRPIHEDALLHFFDPTKKGQKFEYKPRPKPIPVIKEREVGSPGAIDAKRKGEDVEETPLPDAEGKNRPRYSQYRDQDGKEGTSHKEQKRQEAINTDSATHDYAPSTVLLETCLLYGEISLEGQDVVQRVDEWLPSDETQSDLREHHTQTPKAIVRFTSEGNGTIRYVVTVLDVTPYWRSFWVKLFPRPLFLHCISFLNGFWGILHYIRVMWTWYCNYFWG